MTEHTHWLVPPDHPAFAGHFPGTPVLPGAVLLDVAVRAIANSSGISLEKYHISSVKFLSPAGPGDELDIQHTISPDRKIRFQIMSGSRIIASGRVSTAELA